MKGKNINIYNEKEVYLREEYHLVNEIEKQFAIAKIGQNALTIENLHEFMQEVTLQISQILNIELVNILQYNPDESKFELIAGVGWKENYVGTAYIGIDHDSQTRYPLLHKRPIIVKDFKEENRFKSPDLLTDHNVRSGISITIPGKDRPFGILGAHSTFPREYTQADENFLHSLSIILSSTISNYEILAKLRLEKEKYKTLMENASDGIFIADKNGKCIEVNSKACELTQYSKEELLTKNIRDLLHPDELDKPLRIEEILEAKTIISERKLLKKDGSYFIADISAKILPNGSLQGIVRDITKV